MPKKLQSGDVCPTCKRRIGPHKPVKICAKCKRAMGHGDKFFFTDKGTIEHRNCKSPESYT